MWTRSEATTCSGRTIAFSVIQREVKENAQPFSLFTPRNVPLPLRKKVKDELVHMESLGAVPKKSGDARICVHFRPLNESVL